MSCCSRSVCSESEDQTSRVRECVDGGVDAAGRSCPAESAAVHPNDKVAADQWAAELDGASLRAAAESIQSYSVAYRRAIMGALSPDRRAAVWRNHIDAYVGEPSGIWTTPRSGRLKTARAALTATVLGERPTARPSARSSRRPARCWMRSSASDEANYVTRDLGPRGNARGRRAAAGQAGELSPETSSS